MRFNRSSGSMLGYSKWFLYRRINWLRCFPVPSMQGQSLMDKDRSVRKMYAEHLQAMVYSKTIEASAVPELIKFIDDAFTNWEKSLVDELGQKALAWETAMGDDDKSLYTLGIRHSIDAIKGVSKNEYQPIGEDFREKKNQ